MSKVFKIGMTSLNNQKITEVESVEVVADKEKFNCTIVEKPFYDPKKKIASA